MQSPLKPHFASWLLEQVGTGEYAGLCYVDQNKFRIPWKHNSRRDCNDEDGKIFKAWAVVSGTFDKFPNDRAKWKTNFRCNMNNLTKHFRMCEDNSKNSEDPHKIYEIIYKEYNYEIQHMNDPLEVYNMSPDIYSSPTDYSPSGDELDLLHELSTLELNGCLPDEHQSTENYVGHIPVLADGYQSIQSVGATTEQLQVSQNHIPVMPEPQPTYHANPAPVPQLPPQPTIYDLEISVHYRKREVMRRHVTSSLLQLHYQCEAPEPNAYTLCFPSTEDLLDHKQIELTNKILNSIQRGLLLKVEETGIYACRKDRCRVFASTGDHRGLNPRKLPQDTTEEVLSFEKYITELKRFRENDGPSPNYTITMCFGEEFPDGKPLERKLITVKVVPLICRYFHELAQSEGASSLHSSNVSLQISHHNSLYDLINTIFYPPAADEEPQVTGGF